MANDMNEMRCWLVRHVTVTRNKPARPIQESPYVERQQSPPNAGPQ
jgi:hypothetical protein